jgi:protein SCO1
VSAPRAVTIGALAGVALALGIAAGIRLLAPTEVTVTAADAPDIGGYVLDTPRTVPPFELVDGQGEPFRHTDFEGEWSLLYFGFTYCPDVCPLALVELAGMKQTLAETHGDIGASYYLVSVDPARDTPERIGEYVAYFDPEFRGLTGALDQIDLLAKAAAVLYVIPEVEEGEPYLVGHSSTITVIDPEGRVYAVFTSPLEADSLAADFATMVEHYRTRE